MRTKKILIIAFAFIICLLSAFSAFAVEDTEIVLNTEITEIVSTEENTEVSDNILSDEEILLSSEPTNAELIGEIPETEINTESETRILTAAPETTNANELTPKENRVTIYFKDVEISFSLEIKNIKTKEKIKMDLNSDNYWTYSGVIEPGTYEITSYKAASSQCKITGICDKEGKEIDKIEIAKTGDGIQVINLYPQSKVTFGLLHFFKKNIFFDVCVVLLIVLYIINTKGYRIPVLSNWIDNYRNN